MIKIAILGCDSSHTEAFTELINNDNSPFYGKAEVVSIWGEDYNQALVKSKMLSIKNAYQNINEALIGADAAMILGRFPESHLEPSIKALNTKIPIYIDKPLFTDLSEVEKFENQIRSDARFFSGSIYRFSNCVQEMKNIITNGQSFVGTITGPKECNDLGNDSRFMDLNFYGIHSVDSVLEIFGHEVVNMSKIKTKAVTSVTLKFKNDNVAVINLLSNMEEEYYHFSLASTDKVSIIDFKVEAEIYEKMFEKILTFFEGGVSPVAFESNKMALKIIDFGKG